MKLITDHPILLLVNMNKQVHTGGDLGHLFAVQYHYEDDSDLDPGLDTSIQLIHQEDPVENTGITQGLIQGQDLGVRKVLI